ncbi:hypothetical protein EON83_23630 [bacterium]|nr:MAG: hypothetical protein EON83_23630 [bacterium]
MKLQPRLSAPTLIVSVLLVCDIATHFVGAQETPTIPKVITAQEFRLASPQGKTLATLSSKASDASLVLFDGSGKKRVELMSDLTGEPTIVLNNKSERPQIRLTTSGNTPYIQILNKNGEPRSSLTLASDDGASFSLSGAGTDNRTGFSATPSRVTLFDKGGTPRASMYLAGANQEPIFTTVDKTYTTTWLAPPKQKR